MWRTSTSINLQDKDTNKKVSIVPTLSDITKNGLVICNPDWSALWPFLKLDQTTPQTVTWQWPVFDVLRTNTLYTPTGSEAIGSIYWSEEDEMFVWVGNNWFKYNFGDELTTLCQNDTWVTITDGTPVMYAEGIWSSWNIRIVQAIADWSIKANYMLWLATQDIIDWDRWKVTRWWKVRAISQDLIETGQTWSEWDLIYVSENEAGKLTNVQPQAPNCSIFVWAVTALWDSVMTIDVWIEITPKLTDLCDVNGTPLTTTGQILVWDNTRKVFDFNYNITDLDYSWLWWLTAGSIPFADANWFLTEDNNNLFWNNTNKRLWILTNNPWNILDVNTDIATEWAFIGSAFVWNWNWAPTYATFSHNNFNTSSVDYALIQTPTGRTYLNASAWQDIRFLLGGSNQMLLNSDWFGIWTTTPNTSLHVAWTTSSNRIQTDTGLNLQQVSEPTTLWLVAQAGSWLEIWNYFYLVVYYTDIWQTYFKYASVTTTAWNQQVEITLPISSDYRVIWRKIYRTKVNWALYSDYYLDTIADNTTTTYIDTTPDSSLTLWPWDVYFRDNTTNDMIKVSWNNAMTLWRNVTAFWLNTAESLTTGWRHVLVGYLAWRWLTSWIDNTIVWYSCWYSMTTGNNNNLLWAYTGRFITSGTWNTWLGSYSLFSLTTGSYNTAINRALLSVVDGGWKKKNQKKNQKKKKINRLSSRLYRQPTNLIYLF